MFPTSIHKITLDAHVWNAVLDEDESCLFLEIRNEDKRTVEVMEVDLKSHQVSSRSLDLVWWNKLLAADQKQLFFVEYHDTHDPNNQSFFKVNLAEGKKSTVDDLPTFEERSIHPNIYEAETAYHQTVSGFLSLELPISCEYLEWNEKIIISYYVRSGSGFDRYLLLINDGTKVWKIRQDEQMKGFSPGAFFVFENQLIFIKDRNEVCVYTD